MTPGSVSGPFMSQHAKEVEHADVHVWELLDRGWRGLDANWRGGGGGDSKVRTQG